MTKRTAGRADRQDGVAVGPELGAGGI